jgi:HlyD family type I secretion membrane fusion protein
MNAPFQLPLARLRLLREPSHEALNGAIELEERPPPESLTRLVGIICGLIVLIVLWAMVTRVDIVVRAPGAITPAGDVIAIQHAEGGTVAEILVSDGEAVSAGQALLRLAPTATLSERNRLLARRATLLLTIERERAIAEGRAPKLNEVIQGFEAQKAEQSLLYAAERNADIEQRNVLASQLAQQRNEDKRLANQIAALVRDAAIADEELRVRRGLLKKGLTTRDRYYNAQRDASDLHARLANLRDERARTASSIAEAQHKLAENDSETRAKAREKAALSLSELEEVEQALASASDRTRRLSITSPVNGIVKGLTVKSLNAVVRPGEAIAEIVPVGARMVVTAQVRPQDIGQLKAGDPVDVRVLTFDFTTYGSLPGTVERVSASTFQSDDGTSYYKAIVTLKKGYFGRDPNGARVLPGMTAEVDIKTGRRSIMSYLLKPVTRGWNSAFRER